jgi:hypothetical protein
LLEGEVGYVTDNPNQYKIGDGVHTWNELPLRGFDGILVHELGNSQTAAMSQQGVSYSLLFLLRRDVYFSEYFINSNPSWFLNIGEKIEKFSPSLFTKLSDYKSSEEPPLVNYTTYVIKNDTTDIFYVYVNFRSDARYSDNFKYLKVAIFDENDNNTANSYEDGSLLLGVYPKNTLVISGNTWVSEPRRILLQNLIYDYSYDSYIEKNKNSIGNYVESYEKVNLLSNYLITQKEANCFTEGHRLKVLVKWDANVDIGNYAYITQDIAPNFDFNYNYHWEIYNKGDYPITINIGLTKGVHDWSEGYIFKKESVVINPGEKFSFTANKYDIVKSYYDLNGRDRGNIYDLNLQYTYMHTVLYGDTGANTDIFSHSGNIEVSMYYTINNDIYETNTENSRNSGWLVGGLPKNAIFRDENPNNKDSFTKDAMSVIQIDYRTIKLITNITSSVMGSVYRGIYWRIYYNNLEDLKGIWRLTSKYNKYDNCHIHWNICDWSPNEHDVIDIDNPEGAYKDYDLYSLITNYKSVHSEDGKWTGILENQGFLYISFLNYNKDGYFSEFEDILTLDFLPNDSKVIASEFTPQAEERILQISQDGTANKTLITNWGDSLTAGAGSSNHDNQSIVLSAIRDKGYPDLSLSDTQDITYSIMMQALLGDDYNVMNCGVGGENINTIAARQGATYLITTNDFTLPSDTTPIQIGDYTTRLMTPWGRQASPLLQGDGNSVNPCYVEGIECTLKWTGTSWSDSNGTYTIQRVATGDREIKFSNKTPIILYGSQLSSNAKIAVLWCWQNGGYNDDNDLIEKLDKMISTLQTNKYLIIGLHSGDTSTRETQENALSSKYGGKFFNWRQYISTNGMYDFGLTPTEEDLTAMSKGECPKSLLKDNVHLKAAGYAILGFKIIERFKALGYVS